MTGITVFNTQNCGIHQSGITVLCFRNDGSESSGILRSAKEFETRYLRKGFSEKITVYRILDSRGEEFKLSKAYEHKVDVVNVITAPEIEMLIIFTEKKYKAYKNEKRKNPQLKPSDFCKINLKYTKVKQYDFVKEYFADIPVLLNALHEYKSKSRIQKNEKTLWDLLREDARLF